MNSLAGAQNSIDSVANPFKIDSELTRVQANSRLENSVGGTHSLSSLMGQRTEYITFTYNFYLTHPELFGDNAEVLMYAQHAGHKFKPESYYAIFETFINHRSDAYINDRNHGIIRHMHMYDIDFLISWARIIQQTQQTIEFEPVLRDLKTVLNAFFANPNVLYGGISYPINTFKSLCYTHSGEQYVSLLPYICYLITFFIHCHPYEFDEGQSDSSTYGFYKSLDAWYLKHYTSIGEDNNVDILRGSMQDLAKIPDKQWSTMLNHMLNVDEIIRLRNAEIRRTPDLLEQCISQQSGLTIKYLTKSFNETMSTLIKIVIENNPVKRVFDTIPRFNSSKYNLDELMMWTQYCLAGGDKPFCIDQSTGYSYLFHGDVKTMKNLPSAVFSPQSLPSQINPLQISLRKPFCAADLLLELCTSHLRSAFIRKSTDILDDNPLTIDASMMNHNQLNLQSISVILKNLFIPGLWMYDNDSMVNALGVLMTNNMFMAELIDLLELEHVTQIVYQNRFASIMICTYILSYANTLLLSHCTNNLSLNGFSIYQHLSIMPFDQQRISKISDILYSLIFISTPNYCSFINNRVNEFVAMITNASILQQPYIKGLNDQADIYAIGGCDVYNFSHFTNPLIRGYGFITRVFGNCESIETFFRWIQNLDNKALFEFISESITNSTLIEKGLKVQWQKMMESKTFPKMLANYHFSPAGYRFKTNCYFLDLTLSDGIPILDVLCKYSYKFSDPKLSIARQIYMRPILISKNVPRALRSQLNAMRISSTSQSTSPVMLSSTGSSETIPVYDFNGSIEETSLSYVPPAGANVVKLLLFNSRYSKNNVVWIFTSTPNVNRFQRYDTDSLRH